MNHVKLVHPRAMSAREMRAYRFCLASASLCIPRDEMAAAIVDELSSMEDGVWAVRRQFQLPDLGEMDALACDRGGRAVLIDVHEILKARHICLSFQRMDWMNGNAAIMGYIHPEFRARCDARCWLVARCISADAQALLGRIESGAPEIFECGCLELAGERWLVVQKRVSKACPGGVPDSQPSLTEEEIEDFMNSPEEDEITSRCPS